MKSINTFEVHLDLDNCSSLYDYLRCERHERPPGGWGNLSSIVNRARRSPDDVKLSKNLAKTHKRLAITHTYRGFFENVRKYDRKKQGDVPVSYSVTGTLHPVVPPWLLPVFQPGDIINGVVVLQAEKKIEAENIKVHLLGAARTRIRVYTDAGYFDYVGYEQYVNTGIILWKRNQNGNTTEAEPLLLVGELASKKFSTFPFEFQIPEDARPSLPELVQNGDDFAHVSYYLKATIDKGKTMKRGNIVVHQPLWVIQREHENVYYIPSQVLKTKKVGYFNPNNTIHCTVSIPQSDFLQSAKTLPATVEIENLSSSKIRYISCRLMLTGSYRNKVTSWNLTRKVIDKGLKVKSGPVEAGMCPLFQLEIPVGFKAADGYLLPRGPHVNCGLIELEYELCVVVKLRGLHRNMHISVPVKVCEPESETDHPLEQMLVPNSDGGADSDEDPTDV